MFLGTLYTMLQEKDEKIEDKTKEENLGDNEETTEKNQDKKKIKKEEPEPDNTDTDTDDDAGDTDDEDELFSDIDNETPSDPDDSGIDATGNDDTSKDNDASDRNTTTDDEEIPEDDNSEYGDEEPVDTDPEFVKIKNINKKKKLLADIIELYEFYGKLIYKIDGLRNLSPDENKIVDGCILRLTNTKKMIFDYIQTMYNVDSYERALSMYINFKIPINFTEEIITKIGEKRNNT